MPINTGQLGTPLPASSAADPVELEKSFVRLDGNMVGVSTEVTYTSGATPVVGNTYVVPGGYRALSYRYLRETPQDGGQLIIGGAGFVPGSGPQYQESGIEWASDNGESYPDPVTITVTGDVFVQIDLVRDK